MKKTLNTITLITILAFGATFANAGIIIGSRNAEPCVNAETEKNGIIIGSLVDIIYSVTGILVADVTTECSDQERSGIIIGS